MEGAGSIIGRGGGHIIGRRGEGEGVQIRGHQCNGSRLVAVVKVISERLNFDSLIYFNMSDNINTDANG